ncbi:hypothetical protein ACIQCM_13660 [Pseudarthrobacter sp. NPDC092439]|uniref:hypothetical protein n=2 Tax=unclassified Pseudarthrobacter TaxID=2647000 RepID=UPI00382FA5EC
MHSVDMHPSSRKWKSTAAAVLGLLNDLDPYNFEPGTPAGAPHDEYENEAHSIASLLFKSGSVSRSQVDVIWREWFQEPLSEVIGAVKADRFCVNLNSIADSA